MAVDPDVEFLEAPDGAAALTVLEENEVDLVVTDINMPKMDGVTFVWKIRMHSATAELPVIVLSSMKNDRLKSALEGLGVEIFIQKPISPAKIAEYVEEPV
jgi:CheY-like chemotaxis protein